MYTLGLYYGMRIGTPKVALQLGAFDAYSSRFLKSSVESVCSSIKRSK